MPPPLPLPPSPPPLPPATSRRPFGSSPFATAATRSSLEVEEGGNEAGELNSERRELQEPGGVALDSWLLADLQIPPERQTGPTCGLVALHMATRAIHANASAPFPGVTELLAEAAERGFSTQVSQRGRSIRVHSHHTPSCRGRAVVLALP